MLVAKEIKGFERLTPEQQQLLISVNARHKAGVGNDCKDGWTPVKVKPISGFLKVNFKNGDWLYYTQSGDWF